MKWKIGTSEELKKDVKFQKIFKDIGIKIYDEQPSGIDDILLECI